MSKGRLEAFSDGVIAIIITIMVLELKVPHETTLAALGALAPVFLSYVLSFIYVGIYWNNHHHMFHAVERFGGAVLWANLHLLFWLSLVPFATGWLGENHLSAVPVAVYGTVLLGAAIAYGILTLALRRHHGPETAFARALGTGKKEILSIVAYAAAIALACVAEWVSLAIYIAIAIAWLIPDRRYERALRAARSSGLPPPAAPMA